MKTNINTNILEQNQNYINRWVVSYADFVTLLLALFTVMYALSQLDLNNMKAFSSSINRAFDVHSGHLQRTNTSLDEKTHLLKLFKTTETRVYIDNGDSQKSASASKELKKQLSSSVAQIDKESDNFDTIKSRLDNNNQKDISIIREPRGLLIRLNNAVLFDNGSDIIKDKALGILDKIAVALKDEPNSLRIEGHTDNLPIKTEKFPSNWELSTARATNIIKYLVKVHKISPDKISATGYGEYAPISDNKTPEGRAENRRVDIIVLSSSSKIFEPVGLTNPKPK